MPPLLNAVAESSEELIVAWEAASANKNRLSELPMPQANAAARVWATCVNLALRPSDHQVSGSASASWNRLRRRYAILARAVQTRKDGKIKTHIPSFKAAIKRDVSDAACVWHSAQPCAIAGCV